MYLVILTHKYYIYIRLLYKEKSNIKLLKIFMMIKLNKKTHHCITKASMYMLIFGIKMGYLGPFIRKNYFAKLHTKNNIYDT